MNFRDLSRDDVLHAIGLETRKSVGDFVLPALGIFSAGILVGAGLGMLFAPKTGGELRSDLRGRVGGVAEKMRRNNGEAESRPGA